MPDPRIEMLKSVPLFAECDDKQLAFIATQVDEVDFVAGRDLCREGSGGGEFFIILSGNAEVRRQGRHLRELGPGDFFGEIALLDGGPRTATVTATSDVTLYGLTEWSFRGLMQQHPSIAVKTLIAMAGRLRNATKNTTS